MSLTVQSKSVRNPIHKSFSWFALLLCVTPAVATPLLTVSPSFASVHRGEKRPLKSTVVGATSAQVRWEVNGIPGGNSTVGTISTTGLYVAPTAVPVTSTVMVTAQLTGAEPASLTLAITSGLSFYVSTTGKDTNPGTLALPWRTIQHAADTSIAGDTTYIRKGVYHESVSLPHSGSARDGSIVFQSYPGELAILDGTDVACCGDSIRGLVNLVTNESYIVVAGLELQNYTSNNSTNEPAGIYVSGSGSYLNFLNNIVHGITETAGPSGNAHGIGIYGTSTTPLSNIVVSGNVVYGLKTGNSETIVFDGNVVEFQATGNVVHDNDNIAIDATGFYKVGPTGHDQTRNGLIAGNVIYNITSLRNPSYNSYGADGIYCDGCTLVVIERNLIYDCDLNIEAASENAGHVASYVTVRNNVVYGGNLAGISIGGYASTVGGSDHITIVNNTLYNNDRAGQGGDFQIQYHATNNIFENNIVYSGTPGIMLSGQGNSASVPLKSDFNLYYTAAPPQWWYQGREYITFASYQAGALQDGHSHFENPGLVSVLTPYNFDLNKTSPARAAGLLSLGAATYGTLDFAGNPRIRNNAISIGAYEQ